MIRDLYAALYRMSVEKPHRFLRLMLLTLAALVVLVRLLVLWLHA